VFSTSPMALVIDRLSRIRCALTLGSAQHLLAYGWPASFRDGQRSVRNRIFIVNVMVTIIRDRYAVQVEYRRNPRIRAAEILACECGGPLTNSQNSAGSRVTALLRRRILRGLTMARSAPC
jgi:hypothetical protein